MKQETDLSTVKVGEPVLLEELRIGRVELYLARCVRRSATRLTVILKNRAMELTFTNDGNRYPRQRGYYADRTRLIPANPENLERYRRSLAIRRAFHYSYKLSELTKTRGWDQKLSEMEIRNLADVLEKYLALIDQVNLNETEE